MFVPTIRRRHLIGVSVALLAGAAVASACAPQNNPPVAAIKAPIDQRVTLMIRSGQMGTDGKMHDTFTPSEFSLQSLVPAYLTILNYTADAHSFAVPALNLNLDIKPGSEAKPFLTTATFVAATTGVYAWRCERPCDGDAGNWDMSANYGTLAGVPGLMSGMLTVS